ncbi:LysR family transcriptional regulator ArgP [Mycolicibacterium sp. BiH015]|uniref:LysR family transcriptional regulator ArgP n=1 Tax=Mycolicibacterium sp. BiH015 TaxID=3018808 RepID=UPI0022E05083|nr:LysR family transcriptional regulator ArgP [Mycolicibacterium sp. BiH015]MDA2892569.1 LysR family transcriptional regulator ArgP [Mycolicibacterium sp. BiH015]
MGDQLDSGQLAALSAVVESGSFDAAAERLHVTPSAISQRIKALEQRVGQVLVLREKPCVPTVAGVPLLRLAAQMALLESEALAEMRGGISESPRVALAVNADSMATWFTEVFERLPHVLFDVRIEDQDHSARLLREGVVMGAVTTERKPVGGCRVQPLGVMRYLPVATPAFVERFLPGGFTREAASHAPSLAWNRDDALQDQLLRKVFRTQVRRPTHYIPTAAGFGAAVHAGLGWGMYPISLIDESFVPITDQHLDVPLYWQCWKLDSTTVTEVTDAVESAAAGLLRGL